MRVTLRAKLVVVLGAAVAALLLVLGVSAATGLRGERALDDMERRLVPKVEVGPRIEAAMERLARSMQDAVAAQDAAALAASAEHKTELFALITRAGPALDPSAAAAVRWAVQDYFESAQEVSRRMIAGESGEALLADVARMQQHQQKAREVIKSTTTLGHGELAHAFASVRLAARQGDRLRLGAAAVGCLLVILLASWGARGLLRGLSNLTDGLERFGTADFSTPIPVTSDDELGAVAREANRMAESLQRSATERGHREWLKESLAELSSELRGELLPAVVAERALTYLTARVAAPVGALYLMEDDGTLRLYACCGGDGPVQSPGHPAAASFRPGEGLVGQALLAEQVSLIDDLPADYVKIRSGLGESPPRQLLLAPLVHAGRKLGVVELALLSPASARVLELMEAALPALVMTLDASRSGAARSRLLAETQAQAEQLGAQEEELRLSNQELLAQQDELRRANAELEEARAVLQERAEELRRVSSYKSQFLANMSHELRTPLNSMLLLSQLLAENDSGNLTSKQIEHLRTVHAAGQDLLGLINGVLDLSKIEAGKQDLNLQSVELAHFPKFVRRLFDAAATQRGITLVTELAGDLPREIVTDRQRVERVLVNLIGNALKFTERGTIALRVGRPDGALKSVVPGAAVVLSVSDTGRGIPEAARERVFSPFEQVAGGGDKKPMGTGLGLSIARESARLLGGDLVLAETSEHGSVFACVLPELAPPAQASRSTARQVDDDSATLVAGEPHLLIIEDDPVLAERLVALARARRVKAVVAASGEEGLRIARRGGTLGIVLDVKLPDIDGFSVMQRLKHDPVTRHVPVHFVSGVHSPQRGLALGAIGYLVKPASLGELSNVIRLLLPQDHGTRRVLVVEDDAAQGSSIRTLLEREGLAAVHVQTAGAALDELSHGSFGCLVLDLGLPDMDGLGLLRALRARPELGGPRVVIHTGRELSKQEMKELSAYAEAVVLKDGSSAERLLEEIHLFIRHLTEQQPPPPLHATRSDVSLKGAKLLLAEDDMRTVYSLSALLRSRGADVLTAETGREALELLSKNPDVSGVLMDVMMPEMDGYEAMRQLRSDERFSKLPVIALTAKAMKGERERCLAAGASAYLPKPIDGDALLRTLHTWLAGEVA